MALTAAQKLAIARGKGRGFFDLIESLDPAFAAPLLDEDGTDELLYYDGTDWTTIGSLVSGSASTSFGRATVGAADDPSRCFDPGSAGDGGIRNAAWPHPFTSGVDTGCTIMVELHRHADDSTSDAYFIFGNTAGSTLGLTVSSDGGATHTLQVDTSAGYQRFDRAAGDSTPELLFIRLPLSGQMVISFNGSTPVSLGFGTYNGGGAVTLSAAVGLAIARTSRGDNDKDTRGPMAHLTVWDSVLTDEQIDEIAAVWDGSSSYGVTTDSPASRLATGVYGSRATAAHLASAGSRVVPVIIHGDSTLVHQGSGWGGGLMASGQTRFGLVASHVHIPANSSDTRVNNATIGTNAFDTYPLATWELVEAAGTTAPAGAIKDLLSIGSPFGDGTRSGTAFLPQASTQSQTTVVGITPKAQLDERMRLRMDYGGPSSNGAGDGQFELAARNAGSPYGVISPESGGDGLVADSDELEEDELVIPADAARAAFSGVNLGKNTGIDAYAEWSGALFMGVCLLDWPDRTVGIAISPWVFKGGADIGNGDMGDQWYSTYHTARLPALARAWGKYRRLCSERGQPIKVTHAFFTGFNETGDDSYAVSPAFFFALHKAITFIELVWQSQGWDVAELDFVFFPSALAENDPGDAELVSYEEQGKALASTRKNMLVVALRERLEGQWETADQFGGTDPVHYSTSGFAKGSESIFDAFDEAIAGGSNPALRIRAMKSGRSPYTKRSKR